MIKSLDRLTDQYTADIEALDVSGATEADLIVPDLTTQRISKDLLVIKLQLQQFTAHKQFKSLDSKVNHLQYVIDSTRYSIGKRRGYIKAQKPDTGAGASAGGGAGASGESATEATGTGTGTSTTGAMVHEDITSLRKRLLSTSSIVPQQQVNAYHDNLQNDLINDLSTLAGDLKLGAYNLSMKILDDNNLLTKTGDDLMKNNSLMDVVGDNLNSYVMNKSGGKILFWFLLKTLGAILTLFLAMIIIVKIFPKL